MTEDVDVVRAWRTPDHERFLWMRGITTGYCVDPVGEFIIGVAARRPYRLRRGRSSQLVSPGRLVVLDAEQARLLLLDYRGRADHDPAVRVVGGLERSMLREVLHLARFDELLARLRPQLRGFEDVAQPWTPAPRAQEPADA